MGLAAVVGVPNVTLAENIAIAQVHATLALYEATCELVAEVSKVPQAMTPQPR